MADATHRNQPFRPYLPQNNPRRGNQNGEIGSIRSVQRARQCGCQRLAIEPVEVGGLGEVRPTARRPRTARPGDGGDGRPVHQTLQTQPVTGSALAQTDQLASVEQHLARADSGEADQVAPRRSSASHHGARRVDSPPVSPAHGATAVFQRSPIHSIAPRTSSGATPCGQHDVDPHHGRRAHDARRLHRSDVERSPAPLLRLDRYRPARPSCRDPSTMAASVGSHHHTCGEPNRTVDERVECVQIGDRAALAYHLDQLDHVASIDHEPTLPKARRTPTAVSWRSPGRASRCPARVCRLTTTHAVVRGARHGLISRMPASSGVRSRLALLHG